MVWCLNVRKKALQVVFGANGMRIFAMAVPALRSISTLRYEDAASIGAGRGFNYLLINY
jgi:hypothetical protein